MAENLGMVKTKQWIESGCLLKDFYDIFNVPYPTYYEVSKAIQELSELFDNYSAYMTSIITDNKRNKIEENFKLLFADIFGELGVSVKLAGEGYISYSLREIRAVLDLLFAGLFTVSSWTPRSVEYEEGINPMAQALFSGYWGKLKEFNFDSLVLPIIQLGEEGKPVPISLQELSNEFYPHITSKFNFDRDKISKKWETIMKTELQESLYEFFINFSKKYGIWSDIAKEGLGNTEHFYELLIINRDVSLRSCKIHEENLLKDLRDKLGISGELTDDLRKNLSELTFELTFEREPNDGESNLCDYCENEAVIYGIYGRPKTRAMVKLIKLQLESEELKGINSCVKESLKMIGRNPKETYFGDIIYSEIYSKLNDYVHSNIVKEPTISEWFYDFFLPTIIVLQCILSRPLWFHNQIK
ncbi:MAG: hypothetical protein M1166_07925 [Candidatus Thermoplasmatota archaeon]|nr:hypothetical protein [Candidatus Thermoplasmatota archaeon]